MNVFTPVYNIRKSWRGFRARVPRLCGECDGGGGEGGRALLLRHQAQGLQGRLDQGKSNLWSKCIIERFEGRWPNNPEPPQARHHPQWPGAHHPWRAQHVEPPHQVGQLIQTMPTFKSPFYSIIPSIGQQIKAPNARKTKCLLRPADCCCQINLKEIKYLRRITTAATPWLI